MQSEFDVWWKVKCYLHLSQAVEGKEGMSLYLCDAVALGNLTVAQRNGSTSVNRLTRSQNVSHQSSKYGVLAKQILRVTQVMDSFPCLLFNALLLEIGQS